MRTNRDFYPLAFITGCRAVVLVNRKNLIQAPGSFSQIHLGTKGKQRFRIDVTANLIVGEEKALRCIRGLRPQRKQKGVAIEVTCPRAHVERRGTGWWFDVSEEDLIVQLFPNLEWQVQIAVARVSRGAEGSAVSALQWVV